MARNLATEINARYGKEGEYQYKKYDIGVYLQNVIGFKQESRRYVAKVAKSTGDLSTNLKDGNGTQTYTFLNKFNEELFKIYLEDIKVVQTNLADKAILLSGTYDTKEGKKYQYVDKDIATKSGSVYANEEFYIGGTQNPLSIDQNGNPVLTESADYIFRAPTADKIYGVELKNKLKVHDDARITGSVNVETDLDVSHSVTLGSANAEDDELHVLSTSKFDKTLNIMEKYIFRNDKVEIKEAAELSKTLTVDGNTKLNANVYAVYDSTAQQYMIITNGNQSYTSNFASNVLTGDLSVDGNTVIGKRGEKTTLDINSDTNLNGAFNITGDTTIDGILKVKKSAILQDTLDVDGATTLASDLTVDGITNLNNILNVVREATFKSNVDVKGDTNLEGSLDVALATRLANTLNVKGSTNLEDSLTVALQTVLNDTLKVVKKATFNNDVQIDKNLSVTENETVGGTLRVTGATTLSDILTVVKKATFNNDVQIDNDLKVSGNESVTGTLGVIGATTLSDILTVVKKATFNNDVQIDKNLSVTGKTILADTEAKDITVENATINKNTTIGGTLGVTGATTLSDILTVVKKATFNDDVQVDGNTDITGTLGVTGSTTLNDILTVVKKATFNSDVQIDKDLTVLGNTNLANIVVKGGKFDTIEVSGDGSIGGNFSVDGKTTLGDTLDVTGATTLKSTLGVSGKTTLGDTLDVTGATTLKSTLGVSGNTTIGGTLGVTKAVALSSSLDVTGATTLKSTLGVSGNTTIGGTLGVTGAASLADTLDVTGATTLNDILTVVKKATFNNDVQVDGNASITGNETVGGALTVTGTALYKAGMSIAGNTLIGGTLGVTGAATLNDILKVVKKATFNDNVQIDKDLAVTGNETISGTLGVTKATTLSSTLDVTGATTLKSTLGVSGNTTIGGTLGVTGKATLNNGLAITGDTTATGSLNLDKSFSFYKNTAGDSYLLRGNANGFFSDFATNTFGGNVLPSKDNTYTLGSASARWKEIHAAKFSGAFEGNASSATKLETARSFTIKGVQSDDTSKTNNSVSISFDGTKNVEFDISGLGYDASKIITGIIDIDRLPKGALERLIPVANKAERLKLTVDDVQKGDTVQEEDTKLMYYVVDESKLGTDKAEEAFREYTVGHATAVPWTGIENKPDWVVNPQSLIINRVGKTVASYNTKDAKSIDIRQISITLNGGLHATKSTTIFDTSTDKTINITPNAIGAAPETGSTDIATLGSTVTLGAGDEAHILQNSGTYHQRINILDNATAGDNVYEFQQSSNGGASFDTLMAILDDGSVKATKFIGAFEGSATKLGTADVGADDIFMYLKAGVATASTLTRGSGVKPVFFSSGKVTESSSDVGSNTNLMYMKAGTLTASNANVAGNRQLMYLKAGVLTASDDNVANSNTLMYLKNGTLTASTGDIATSGTKLMYLGSGSLKESDKDAGSNTKPVYLSKGTITAMSGDIGTKIKPIFMSKGDLTASDADVGNASKPMYMKAGVLTASDSSIGSNTKPMYMNAGTLTAMTGSIGSKVKPIFMNAGDLTASDADVATDTSLMYMKAGTLTASGATVGTGANPVFLSGGTITKSTSTIGGTATPIYMNAGTLTAFTGNIGDADTPVYMKSGAVTTTGKKFSDYFNRSGTVITNPNTGNFAFSNTVDGYLLFSNTGDEAGVARGIGGVNGGTDGWTVRGYQTANNKGALEISVGDDGDEGIYVRQYTSSQYKLPFMNKAGGASGLSYREIILMEPSTGNSIFPGDVKAKTFTGALSGNADTATTATFISTQNNTGFKTDASGNFIHKQATATDYFNIFANDGSTAAFRVYWETGNTEVRGTLKAGGLTTLSGGLKVSGKTGDGGNDEGIVIGAASNGYATLTLGEANGKRSSFYYNPSGTNAPKWRYNNGTSSYEILHPGKAGTIALTSDIPTKLPANGGNADTVDNYHVVSASAGAKSSLLVSDANGYVNFNYINSNTSKDENPSVSQIIVTNSTDNYYRKAGLNHVKNAMGILAEGNYIITGFSGTASWVCLGELTSAGDAANAIFDVYSGDGYNATSKQNTWFRIFVKDGWQSTGAAASSFGVRVYFFDQVNNSSIKVKVIASAANKCKIYAYLPWSYSNGNFHVSGRISLFVADGGLCAEPSGTSQEVDYIYSLTQGNYTNWAADKAHTHNKVQDINDGGDTTFAYSKAGMAYADYTWLAAWNGKELRAVSKDQFAVKGHTHSYLPLSGGTMTNKALITWADSGTWGTSNSPVGEIGGLSWTGQSDTVKLIASETGTDNLELLLQFGDHNSNGLSIQNSAKTTTTRITAGGYLSTQTVKANSAMIIPVLSADPTSPEVGQMWINTSA